MATSSEAYKIVNQAVQAAAKSLGLSIARFKDEEGADRAEEVLARHARSEGVKFAAAAARRMSMGRNHHQGAVEFAKYALTLLEGSASARPQAKRRKAPRKKVAKKRKVAKR